MRIASVLSHAGTAGVSGETLAEVAEFTGTGDRITQLNKDLNHLRAQGWLIDNVAPPGEPAHFRMTSVDNRLRVKLTAPQQAALRRAVLVADRADLADRLGLAADDRPDDVPTTHGAQARPAALSQVTDSVQRSRLLHFSYKGKDRTVHPQSLQVRGTTWYLSGCEDGDDVLKAFVVSRMEGVRTDPPGTATRPDVAPRNSIHPMTWEVDPPIDVTLRTPDHHAPDVVRWLGRPVTERSTDGETELVYRVTNRAALRSRIYLLGTRVRVARPDEVRDEILEDLSRMAGE